MHPFLYRTFSRVSSFNLLKSFTRNVRLSSVRLAEGNSIKMPSLSPTMSEGSIVQWLKKEGDEIQPGDVLCEIQTDKAVVSLENEEEGVLAKIIKDENSKDIKVGELIAVFVELGEDWKSVSVPSTLSEVQEDSSGQINVEHSATSDQEKAMKTLSVVGPAVRNLCDAYGIDLAKVRGSGPHNIVLKGDVLEYIKLNELQASDCGKSPAPSQPKIKSSPNKGSKSASLSRENPFTDLVISPEKIAYADKVLDAKSSVPHSYVQSTACVEGLISLLDTLREQSISVSLDDLIAKCVGYSLQLNPALNCLWNDNEVFPCPLVDLCCLTSHEAGISASLIDNVTSKSISNICAERENGMPVEALLSSSTPGTFTLLSMTSSDLKSASAIINPPQCAAVAVGGACVVESDAARSLVTLTLSYNACAISEMDALRFVEVLSTVISEPSLVRTDASRLLQCVV